MSTYTSAVQLCNSALIKLGLDTISSLNDTNKRAKYCKKQYPILRDKVLYEHPWNFAMTMVQVAQSSTTPVFEWDYSFVLPNDVLRVLNVKDNDDGTLKYEVGHDSDNGNRVLWSNEASMSIKYTRRVTDVTQYSPAFGEVVSTLMAAELAMPLVQSRTIAEFWLKAYLSYGATGRSLDAQEGNFARVITSTWKNARR